MARPEDQHVWIRVNQSVSLRPWVIVLVAAAWCVPLIAYWVVLCPVATVTPQALVQQLSVATGRQVVLVDVRPRAVSRQGHLPRSIEWPWRELRMADRVSVQQRLEGASEVVVVSAAGPVGVSAVRHLQRLSDARFVNLRGGIQEWIWWADSEGHWAREGMPAALPFRQSSATEQLVSFSAFFLIKPIYTALAVVVIIALWESQELDLIALWWGTLFFFVGEMACAVNVLVFEDASYLLEYVHSVGMIACCGFVAFALLESLDQRLLFVSSPDRRCAAVTICGQCIKYKSVPCGLQRIFYLLIPVCAGIAGMLWAADWHDQSFNTTVYGRVIHLGHLRAFQMLEGPLCGISALVLLAASLAVLAWRGTASAFIAKTLFAAGLGPLAFGGLRVVIGGLYCDSCHWFGFWEEATELMLFAAIAAVLWIFRRTLLPHWMTRLTNLSV